MSDDDIAKLDNSIVLNDGVNDTFGDVDLNKYQQKVIKHIAEPYLVKIMKRTGKNFGRIAAEFIIRGPGLTNFNFFDGVLDIIKESLSTDFIDKIGEIYEKDYRFEKAYSAIMNQWEDKNSNIDKELIEIAKNYDNTDKNEKALLRNTLNMVAILLSDKYKDLIIKELKSFYSNPNISKLLKELAYRLNTEVDPSKDVTAQAAKIYLDFVDDNNKVLESGLKPITNLYFMISSAISLGSFRFNYGGKKKVNLNNQLITKLLDIYKNDKTSFNIITNNILNELNSYLQITKNIDDKEIKSVNNIINSIKEYFEEIIKYFNYGDKNKIIDLEKNIRKNLKTFKIDNLYIKDENFDILVEIKKLADKNKNILNIYLKYLE